MNREGLGGRETVNRKLKFGMLLVLAVGTAVAQDESGGIVRDGRGWVKEVSGVSVGATRVKITSPEGAIEVRGGSQPDIRFKVRKYAHNMREDEARRALTESKIIAHTNGDVLELSLERGRYKRVGADFYLTVPKTLLRALLQTAGGGVLVDNIDGEANAHTAGGSIIVDRIGGGVTLETAGGNIKLGTVGGRIKAQTAGGPIELINGGDEAVLSTSGGAILVTNCAKTLRADTAGGEIRIQHGGGDVIAETAGGDVHIGVIAGRVSASTSGGSIQVDGARGLVHAETAGGGIRLWKVAGPVRAETAGGNITAEVIANRAVWADSTLETTVGDVIVYLPADLAFTVRATIESAGSRHRIISDFPLNIRPSNDVPGARELFGEGQVNGGGAQLRIRTTSGNIEIKKAK